MIESGAGLADRLKPRNMVERLLSCYFTARRSFVSIENLLQKMWRDDGAYVRCTITVRAFLSGCQYSPSVKQAWVMRRTEK